MYELSKDEKATNDDTWRHIHEVQKLLALVQADLSRRALAHDQSKLAPPEVGTFAKFTPKLKDAQYGDETYQGFLRAMRPALEHHYAHNSHHPEHHDAGIDGMNLLDVLEMLCDWLASTRRTRDGDIRRSLRLQKERFGISDQLARIMENTLPLLEAESAEG